MYAVKDSLILAVISGLLGIVFLLASLNPYIEEGPGLPVSLTLLGLAVALTLFATIVYLLIVRKRNDQLRLLEDECDIKDVLEFAELHKVSTSYLNGLMPFQYCKGELVGRFFASLLFGKLTEPLVGHLYMEDFALDAIAKALTPLSSGYWCKKFFEGLEQSRHQEYAGKIRILLDQKITLHKTEQSFATAKALRAKRCRKLGLKPESETE